MNPGTAVVVLLVVAWLVQLGFAHRQARVFMHEVRQLQGRGTTAVGVAGRGWGRPRTYVAVAAGADGRVRAARELSGVTVWARSKERRDLQGEPLEQLVAPAAGDRIPAGDRAREAAAMAARTLLESRAGTAADGRGAAEASS